MNSTHLLLFEILIIFHTLSRDAHHVSDDPIFDTELSRVTSTIIGPLFGLINLSVFVESQKWAEMKNNDYLKK